MDKNRVEEIRNMPLDLQDENNAIVNPIKA
jgi:hypothetical protein